MNLSNIDNTQLFNQIHAILLREFGGVPDFGVIAGQAVSSAMMEIAQIGQGRFKDLDVFVLASEAPYCPYADEDMPPAYNDQGNIVIIDRNKNPIKRTNAPFNVEVHQSSFGCNFSEPVDAGAYSVVYAHNDINNPLINYIRVSFNSYHASSASSAPSNAMSILNGFDINVCQIALDMETQTVVWTKGFQDFMFSRSLKCTFFGTPMHSAVRLCSKIKAMPFLSVNFNEEMRKLQTARELIKKLENRRASESDDERRGFLPGNIFSPMYKARFLDNIDMLGNFFTLESKVCVFSDSSSEISPEGKTIQSSIVKTERDMYVINPTTHCEKTVGFVLDIAGNKENQTLHVRLESLSSVFVSIYDFCQRPKLTSALQNLCTHLKSIEGMYSLVWAAKHIKDELTSFRQLHEKNLRKAEAVYEKHYGLFYYMTNVSLKAMVDVAAQIHWLEKNNMHHYVGWLESRERTDSEDKTLFDAKSRYGQAPIYCVSMFDPDFRTKIKIKHQEYMETLSERKVDPRFDHILETETLGDFKDNIIELTSAKTLFLEGQFLGHCVGGYFESVASRRSFIFSISTGEVYNDRDKRSTLELIVTDERNEDTGKQEPEFKTRQHHGKGNCHPAPENIKVATALISALNHRDSESGKLAGFKSISDSITERFAKQELDAIPF